MEPRDADAAVVATAKNACGPVLRSALRKRRRTDDKSGHSEASALSKRRRVRFAAIATATTSSSASSPEAVEDDTESVLREESNGVVKCDIEKTGDSFRRWLMDV